MADLLRLHVDNDQRTLRSVRNGQQLSVGRKGYFLRRMVILRGCAPSAAMLFGARQMAIRQITSVVPSCALRDTIDSQPDIQNNYSLHAAMFFRKRRDRRDPGLRGSSWSLTRRRQ